MRSKRIGKFSISMELIEISPEIVLKLMSKIIIVEAQFHYYDMSVHYVGISDLFEESKSECQVRQYIVFINDEGNVEVT